MSGRIPRTFHTKDVVILRLTALCASLLLSANASALSLADLSQSDVSGSLKDALTQGAQIAVRQLGQPGGSNSNPDVRIELSGKLDKATKLMKQLGMGVQVDQLEAGMNRAAEVAVPQVQGLLAGTVKKTTVTDAKSILKGSDGAATECPDRSSCEQLYAKLLPIVRQTTDEVGPVRQYNVSASQAAILGVVGAKSASVEGYATEQALSRLLKMIAKQEKSIRQSPTVAATSLVKGVFGAIR